MSSRCAPAAPSYITVTLDNSGNAIRFETNGQHLANLDQIGVL